MRNFQTTIDPNKKAFLCSMTAPKNQKAILQKLGIHALNEMQRDAIDAVRNNSETVLLSPTGSGKTLAFLLPIVAGLDVDREGVQALVLVPSRELALQIEQVARDMGAGIKVNAIYGGRPISKDKLELKHAPSLLIGTPGRIADHFRRGTFSLDGIHSLVLDEFDKSLEVGFETEMREVIGDLSGLRTKVLTSATQAIEVPQFVGLKDPIEVNYLFEAQNQLQVEVILSETKDKLQALLQLLQHLGDVPGIVFCNFKDSIQRVSDFLSSNGIEHGCFYGGLEQKDRERALIKFRNRTHQLLLATDLAARGLDVPEIKFIVHYHLPHNAAEFTHRNGRTARMHQDGTAYVLHWAEEELPDFIQHLETTEQGAADLLPVETVSEEWVTLFISGGRKDKISKGDIVGLFLKQAQLPKDALGIIELKQDCAFVSVKKEVANEAIQKTDASRLKKKKVRVKVV